MNKFDQTILEFADNLPSVNSSDVVKKLAPALKSLPTNVSQSIAGIGGAIDDATQKNPEEAMLINRLSDPNAKYTSDERAKLMKILSDRGFIEDQSKPDQSETDQTETDQTEEENNIPQVTTPQVKYGI